MPVYDCYFRFEIVADQVLIGVSIVSAGLLDLIRRRKSGEPANVQGIATK